MTAAILAPLLVYLWPTGSQIKATQVKVTLPNPLSEIPEGGSLQFNAPANYGFKMIDGGGDNYPGKVSFGAYLIKNAGQLLLFSITCSHLGCSVQYSDQAHKFTCPCHGSEFDSQGQVIHGPATAPLSHYAWQPGSQPNEILIQGYSLKGVG